MRSFSSLFSRKQVSEIMFAIESSLSIIRVCLIKKIILTEAQAVNRWAGGLKIGGLRQVWNSSTLNPILVVSDGSLPDM